MVDSRLASERSRRSDILGAAEREFAALGWSGGRIERIAAEAQVNKQLLFHYYASKSGLFTAVLLSVLSRYEPDTTSAATPVDELRLIMASIESAAQAAPGILLAPERHRLECAPAEAAEILLAWRERQQARLAAAVADGQRRGHFRDDVDPHGAAQVALAMALGAGALGRSVGGGAWMVDYCAWR